jgi:hypothetical protein
VAEPSGPPASPAIEAAKRTSAQPTFDPANPYR